MTAVLVFDRDGDAMAFATEEETAGYLEAVDVESGEYAAAYLGDGTVLRLLTPRGQNGPVLVLRTDEKDPAGLLDAIRAFQRTRGSVGEPLDPIDLVDEIWRREWERRRPKRPLWLSRRVHGSGPRSVDRTA